MMIMIQIKIYQDPLLSAIDHTVTSLCRQQWARMQRPPAETAATTGNRLTET